MENTLSATEHQPHPVVEQAERLMAKIEQDWAQTEQFYTELGMDADQLTAAMEPLMAGSKLQQELSAQVAKDQADIEQTVAEEAARLRANQAPTGTAPKVRRNLI
jgi:hypothetical protein